MSLYDAFISYSHAKDKPLAAALQSVMQRLGKPWYRRRALRIFRDDTSLAATPDGTLGAVVSAAGAVAAARVVNVKSAEVARLPAASRDLTR